MASLLPPQFSKVIWTRSRETSSVSPKPTDFFTWRQWHCGPGWWWSRNWAVKYELDIPTGIFPPFANKFDTAQPCCVSPPMMCTHFHKRGSSSLQPSLLGLLWRDGGKETGKIIAMGRYGRLCIPFTSTKSCLLWACNTCFVCISWVLWAEVWM